MRLLTLLVLAALLALAACSDDPGPESCVPSDDPTFGLELEDLDGVAYDLADDECERLVLLQFGATWCPACRSSVPQVQEWHDEYDGPDVRVLSVSLSEDPEHVRQYYADQGVAYPILLDVYGVHGYYWEISAIPTFVLVGWDGEEIMRRVGADDETYADIEAALQAQLADRPLRNPFTRRP
jgi:thiol-disulfide isomerase/thioredoxin